MKMRKTYQVAGHLWSVSGERLCRTMDSIDGFKPFEVESNGDNTADCLFCVEEADDDHAVPQFGTVQYTFPSDGVTNRFGITAEGCYLLEMKPQEEPVLRLWTAERSTPWHMYVGGNLHPMLLRFALWMAYGVATAETKTVALHASCTVYRGRAMLFLGESGTGKSTHSRLWVEHIKGAELLNDDSPIVRCTDDKVMVYGSPWSGKTPCYKNRCYPLAGCVRLRQAPHNHIERLPLLQAYAALHPSCPPEFAYDDALSDALSTTMNVLLSCVPVFRLDCLPDEAAAQTVRQAIFGGKIPNASFFGEVERCLHEGLPVRFRVKGTSMTPLLRDGRDEVVVHPYGTEQPQCGDVVLFRYRGRHMLHRIIGHSGDTYTLQGDGVWASCETCGSSDLLGVVREVVYPSGKSLSTSSLAWRMKSRAWRRLGRLRRFVLGAMRRASCLFRQTPERT